MEPTADPFYGVARASPPAWGYQFEGQGCVGLWPLEALCFALLLDEGVRCDVALAVAFAKCLKTPNHVFRVDVHTRREIASQALPQKYRLATAGTALSSDLDTFASELPGFCRYSCNVGFRVTDYELACYTSDDLIPRCELPSKDAIVREVQRGSAGRLLLTAASSDSLDIAVIVFNMVVSVLDPIRYAETSEGILDWDALWRCRRPEEAAIVVKTLNDLPADVMTHPAIHPKLTKHQMEIVYAAHEVLGRLQEPDDFVKLFPHLKPDAIEVIRIRGYYDNLFSDAASWLDCLLTSAHWWTLELFQYLKTVGASFDGAAGILGKKLTVSHKNTSFRQQFDCLKFCVEHDPAFPTGFSPTSVLNELLVCSYRDRDEMESRSSLVLAAVEYIHQLAVRYNMLGPDPVTRESLLTVLVRNLEDDDMPGPIIELSDANGEPTFGVPDCFTDALKIVAPGDSFQLRALFMAISAGSIEAVEYLRREFGFDLRSVRYPNSDTSVAHYFMGGFYCHAGMRDYLTTMGVFDNMAQIAERAPLQFACEYGSPVQAVHYLRNTDSSPFYYVDGKSLLRILAEEAKDFPGTCAFVWCMCQRYGSDPRWKEMIEDFLAMLAKKEVVLGLGGVWIFGTGDTGIALTWYARLFFLLQRSGVVQFDMNSFLIRDCIALAREANNDPFVIAASIDYTVQKFEHSGNVINVTFETAPRLIPCAGWSIVVDV